MQDSLTLFRHGRGARIGGCLLLLGVVVFGLFISELVLRDTHLECGPASGGSALCEVVESWPLLEARRTPLSPVVGAHVAAGGRNSLRLVLEHADNSASDYQGVGPSGSRADSVAVSLRRHLSGSAASVRHQLREATVSLGVCLALVFVVAPWFLLFFVFGRLRFERGDTNRARVGGSLPPRSTSWKAGTPVKLELRREPGLHGESIYSLVLVVDRHPLVLGIRGTGAGGEEKVRALAEQFARFFGAECTVEEADVRLSMRRGA